MEKQNKTAIIVHLSYYSYHFKGVLIHDDQVTSITAIMQNSGTGLMTDDFLKQIDLSELSGVLQAIELDKIIINYQSDHHIYFKCLCKDESSLFISDQQIILKIAHPFSLHQLPLIGNVFALTDTIDIKEIKIEKVSDFVFSMDGLFSLQGKQIPLCFHSQKKLLNYNEQNKNDIQWIQIHKGIKNLQLNQIGFVFKNQMPYLYFDIDFHISFIQISLLGLYLASDVPQFKKFDVGLLGLQIIYQSPALTIGGSFEVVSRDYYEGSIIIGFAKILISAIGMYQKANSNEHIFIYAALFYPLGGPPCFFIDGLALGIGVQYHLAMPALDKISEFPLLTLLKDKKVLKPKESFDMLKPYLSYQQDEYFFNVGIQIISFGMIKTEALLNIVVKPQVNITLIGTSQVDFPEKNALVHATLNFMVTYNQAEGAIKIMAALQSDSYIIDPSCHLTGGFAVYTWLQGNHAHDFVITVGGYHPAFEKTRLIKYPHYPSVERVGINWIINSHVSISGGGYFALTPSCLMAGGNLSLVYLDGRLKAWLMAYADFLIQWKPWAYDISMGVSIGASYRVDFLFIHKTFTIELAAQIHLWGPEFQGEARISWFIISFTIHFGNSRPIKQDIHFSDVEQLVISQDHNSENDICQIKIIAGVQKELGHYFYQVDNESLLFEVHTAIPVSTIEANIDETYTGADVHVLPMNAKPLFSHMKITIKDIYDQEYILTAVPIYENVSWALWGDKAITSPHAEMIPDVLTGVEMRAGIEVSQLCLPETGTYNVDVLNGLQQVYTYDFNLYVFSAERGKQYPLQQQTYQNIQALLLKPNEYKEKLIKDFALENEELLPLKQCEDFYHCQIHFQETGLDNL